MTPARCIISLEYSGGNPLRDRILEIAALRFENTDTKPAQTFHSLVKPDDFEPDDFTLAILGFKRERLQKAPTFGEIAGQIEQITHQAVLVGLQIRHSYALLRQEFKRLDIRFARKHLCLTQLINDSHGEAHSQTVSAACAQSGIKYGHAMSMMRKTRSLARLFNTIFEKKYGIFDKKIATQLTSATKFPPNLPQQKVDELPQAVGVYYFLDHRGRTVYLGKSKNIRERVLSHFNSDLNSHKKRQMKAQIFDVHYRLTGSELIALLLESDEIKRFMPAFNRMQRRKRYTHGVYVQPDGDGFLQFEIGHIKAEGEPLHKFSSRWNAVRFMLFAAAHYGLPLSHCGLGAYENWFGQSGFLAEDFVETPESRDEHNARAMELLAHHSFPHPNMLIVEKGRNEGEISVVLVENNRYLGYAYLPAGTPPTPDAAKDELIPFRDNPDVRTIILSHLRSESNKARVIAFETQNENETAPHAQA